MNNQRIPKHCDFPTNAFNGLQPYVPPKTRDSTERGRLHELPHGTLLAERQLAGTEAAAFILRRMHEPEDITFASQVLALCGLGTTWHALVEGAPVMRRVLWLPQHARDKWQFRPDSQQIKTAATNHIAQAATDARTILNAVGDKYATEYQRDRRESYGRILGHASTELATIHIGDQIVGGPLFVSDYQVQLRTRHHSLKAIEGVKEFAGTVRKIPTMAQIVDQDSDVAIHWRRNAPNGAYNAFEEAVELAQAA